MTNWLAAIPSSRVGLQVATATFQATRTFCGPRRHGISGRVTFEGNHPSVGKVRGSPFL